MTMNFLRLIAASPLPAISYVPEEITAIKALRSAGLVIALIADAATLPLPAAKECATILAITEKGRRALQDYAFRTPSATPQNGPPMSADAICIGAVSQPPRPMQSEYPLEEMIDVRGNICLHQRQQESRRGVWAY